jgi:tetratricopeptide (TPR) repeat protein
VVALFERKYGDARRDFEQAATIAAELRARPLAAAIDSALGILTQAEGASDRAIGYHAAAVQAFRDLGNRHREGSALYYLACGYLERGEAIQAIVVLDQAATAIATVGAVRYQALIAGARAVAAAGHGDVAMMVVALAAAAAAASVCQSEPALTATLSIHALHSEWPADPPARLRIVERAVAIAAATPGDDPQLAVRLLRARLGDRAATGAVIEISGDGARVRVPGAAAAIDLGRRVPLRRIMAALITQRENAPGEDLSVDALVAAGWPGEYINHNAANNRLHVALTTLRKLGLRDWLQSGEHGYRLSPAVAIVRGLRSTE